MEGNLEESGEVRVHSGKTHLLSRGFPCIPLWSYVFPMCLCFLYFCVFRISENIYRLYIICKRRLITLTVLASSIIDLFFL